MSTQARVPILNPEALTARLEEIKARKGDPPWVELLAFTDHVQSMLICQAPGHENDYHYHHHDEFWIILQGELAWWYEDDPNPHPVKAGDFVFAPKERWHHIEVRGTEPAIRLAVSYPGERHLYDRPGCRPVERK